MDLLFQRYASPFLFVDGMIQTGRFAEFVIEFIKTTNQEKEIEKLEEQIKTLKKKTTKK